MFWSLKAIYYSYIQLKLYIVLCTSYLCSALHENAQEFFQLSQLSLREHLTTFNRFSEAGGIPSSVLLQQCTTSPPPHHHNHHHPPVFWIQLVAFSRPLLHLKLALRAVIACSDSGRGRIYLYLFIYQTCCHFLSKTPVSKCI